MPILKMIQRQRDALRIAVSALALLSVATAQAADPTPAKSVPEQLVDTLEQLAGGPHAGYRANHAKRASSLPVRSHQRQPRTV